MHYPCLLYEHLSHTATSQLCTWTLLVKACKATTSLTKWYVSINPYIVNAIKLWSSKPLRLYQKIYSEAQLWYSTFETVLAHWTCSHYIYTTLSAVEGACEQLSSSIYALGKHTIEWIGINDGNVWKGWYLVVKSLVLYKLHMRAWVVKWRWERCMLLVNRLEWHACGLRQSCVLLPLLFSLYINSLVEKLKAAGVGVECRRWLVTALLYEDDAVLFAVDKVGMRVSLEVLSGRCKQWSVEVNVEKVGLCTWE